MSRTRRAIVGCGYWLAECLRLGWDRSDLDWLEALWWQYHDDNGQLISARETAPDGKAEP